MGTLSDWLVISTAVLIVWAFWLAANWSADVLLRARAEMKAFAKSGEDESPRGERGA